MRKVSLAALAFLSLSSTYASAKPERAPSQEGFEKMMRLRAFATDEDMSGQISMRCSGAVISFTADMSQRALVLTNDHCVQDNEPGVVVTNDPYSRNIYIFSGVNRGRYYRARRIVYATQTETDIAILELESTYAQLATNGVRIRTIEGQRPAEGTNIKLISGFFQSVSSCSIDAFVYRLRESRWTWFDSLKYAACEADHGTSGSPLVDVATGKIVGINNTGNDDGERCSLNNPCEVDQQGTVVVNHGMNYGQQTYRIPGCFNGAGALDLTMPSCFLPGGAGHTDSHLAILP